MTYLPSAVSNKDFSLNTIGESLPSYIMGAAVQVIDLDWDMAMDPSSPYYDRHAEICNDRLSRAGVSLDTHVVVGSFSEDTSYYCEYEHKVEYCSDDRYLLVAKSTIEGWKKSLGISYWDKAAQAGFQDWA